MIHNSWLSVPDRVVKNIFLSLLYLSALTKSSSRKVSIFYKRNAANSYYITSYAVMNLETLCNTHSLLPQNALIAVTSFVAVMRQRQCIRFVGTRQAHPLTSKLYYPHQIELCYSEVRWLNTEPLVLLNIKPQSPGYIVPAYRACVGIIRRCPIIQSYLGMRLESRGSTTFWLRSRSRMMVRAEMGDRTFISAHANCPHKIKI